MKAKFYLAVLLTVAFATASLSTNAQGTWVQKANFGGTARQDAVAFSIGSKGYIGMGYDYNGMPNWHNDFWEYDPDSNIWTQKANFGGAGRRGATGFAIGTKGYIGMGEDSTYSLNNDFWEYDMVSNSWTQKASFGGVAREWAVGFAIGANGYIGTGYNLGSFYNDFWEFDTTANQWTQKANFGGSVRHSCTGLAIGTKGYIGMGYDSTVTPKNDFWEYDTTANQWTQKANFVGGARAGATGFAIGTKGYIGTGYDGNTHLKDFWEYDQGSNTWAQIANFGGTGRIGTVGFTIGTNGYNGTGWDGSYRNDFWEYTPDSTNGIDELNVDNAITIYPNPLTSSSILQLSTQLKDAEVVTYDMVGKVVLKKELTGDRMEIERGEMESGVYFVSVRSGQKKWIKKIVVE